MLLCIVPRACAGISSGEFDRFRADIRDCGMTSGCFIHFFKYMYVFMYLLFFYGCMLSLSQNTLKNCNIVKDFYNLNFYIFNTIENEFSMV